MKSLSTVFYFSLVLYFFYPQTASTQTQDEEEVAFFQQMNTVFQGVNLGQVLYLSGIFFSNDY